MNRLAWLQLDAGVAGDMVLGALLDAGASLEVITAGLDRLDLPGWHLAIERVDRAGLQATKAVVTVADDGHARSYAEIIRILDAAGLPDRVAARSHAAFAALASVEADLHGMTLADVHLHETGGHDALVDIVGTMMALEDLDIDEVRCSTIGVGTGPVRSAHGQMPGPAPATARLLTSFAIRPISEDLETATPTGAALVAALCTTQHPVAEMVLISHGLGAGTRDVVGRSNVVGVLIGEGVDATLEPVGRLECNVDDLSGEQMAAAISGLLEVGALDAWVTPIVMKKGRPAHSLEVLCDPGDMERLADELHRRSGSLGIRRSIVERTALIRSTEIVDLDGVEIRIKRTVHTAKPEFADVLRAAETLGRSPRQVEVAVLALLDQRR
ncbi:MAG: nickel pincer cofactor biosynthesis protein LarC [Actinomycetes bacterium]